MNKIVEKGAATHSSYSLSFFGRSPNIEHLPTKLRYLPPPLGEQAHGVDYNKLNVVTRIGHQRTTAPRIRSSNTHGHRNLIGVESEGAIMKFMLTFTWAPNTQSRAEAIERFQNTGGLPPAGVKLLGRWTRADLNGGFDLLETDDVKALTEFAYMWSDLMQLDIAPIVEDAELGEVFGRALR